MRVAVIAWGSLVWDPRTLRVRGPWLRDGPCLPVEFARISRVTARHGPRLTLVLVPHLVSELQRTCWSLSAEDDLASAREALREREGAPSVDFIPFLDVDGAASSGLHPEIASSIGSWLRARGAADAAIWTGLPSNWGEQRSEPFAPAAALKLLREWQAADRHGDAEAYIRNAPCQVMPAVRRATHLELGWTPACACPDDAGTAP